MNTPNDLAAQPGSLPQIPGAAPSPTVDPVIAALLASGAPVNQTPAPAQPNGLDGPVTSPEQVASPAPVPAPAPTAQASNYQPATNQPGAPEIPVKQLASGDVRGATAAQDAAVTSEQRQIQDTELAKTDALAAHANARAQIYEGHATAQGLVDQQYQVARQKARDDANAETAAWMRDLDKRVAEEPVPGRWWSNQTKFGQAMYLLSLAFGTMAQAKNPNLKNIALEMIQKETEDDVAEQRDRIKRQIEAQKLKGDIIDKRLQAQIADTRDDHTLLSSRLAMIQQAALERANAPGTADQKAAMAEAAQWAGQQRLTIAGQRADRAYAEREGQLNRSAEMARAQLTDKRERDLKAAELQKDYDLARLSADVKLSAKDTKRMENSVVLNPETTGIRVVDPDTGKPVDSPISRNGGLTVAKENEKEARQTAEIASDKYAAMQRVSKALAQDGNFSLLAKRDPQLISDMVKLGYGAARNELDPNGRVTDKDFVAGLEHELGGDLETLSGRVAASTFSASKDKLKALVDTHLRNYPKFVSHKLGSLLDASVPGYEGKIRVDWTPKSVETQEPGNPTTAEIDASYGIKTPIQPPKSLEELKQAQELEKKGVQALPPYRPGSQDKVLKAIADFRGAMPDTIQDRAGKVQAKLDEAGDERASLEVQQAQYEAIKKSNEALNTVRAVLGTPGYEKPNGHKYADSRIEEKLQHSIGDGKVNPADVVELAKTEGLTQLSAQDVRDIIKRAGLTPTTE